MAVNFVVHVGRFVAYVGVCLYLAACCVCVGYLLLGLRMFLRARVVRFPDAVSKEC